MQTNQLKLFLNNLYHQSKEEIIYRNPQTRETITTYKKKINSNNLYIRTNQGKHYYEVDNFDVEINNIMNKNLYLCDSIFSYKSYSKKSIRYTNVIFININYKKILKYKDLTSNEMYQIIYKENSRFFNALNNYCVLSTNEVLYLFIKLKKTIYFNNYENNSNTLYDTVKNKMINRLSKYNAIPTSDINEFSCSPDVSIIKEFNTKVGKSLGELHRLVKKYNTRFSYKERKETLKEKLNIDKAYYIESPKMRDDIVNNRIQSMDALLYLRNNNLKDDTDNFIFIYSALINCITRTNVDTLNIIKELNNKLVIPLTDNQLIKIVNNISEEHFKFKNLKVKELLNITDKECDLIMLVCDEAKTIYNNNKKSTDKYKLKYSKREVNKIRILDIIKNNPDASNKVLMKLTGLSLRQVIRYKKQV